MPPARQQIHMRQIELTAFLREDKLWDLEATLRDRKTQTFEGGAGDIPAGTPMHDLELRVTIDVAGTVKDASARMHAVPYANSCHDAEEDYRLLVGLNLFHGFRAALKARIGLRTGCSHLSEMALMLPTLAIQSFAGIVYPVRDDGSQTERPRPLDRCRGLRTDGAAAREYFPRWYEKP